MLTYMSLEFDSQPVRAAKLKALQDYFKTSDPTPFNMLPGNALSKTNTARGKDLVINSHGNKNVFAGYTPEQFLEHLQGKGLENGAFDAIYLMACLVGKQGQSGSQGIFDTFALQLRARLNEVGIETKLYAPRGYLSYTGKLLTKSGQTYYKVEKMFIRSPERNYPLKEGLLLVRF